jgi:hypothetical protein
MRGMFSRSQNTAMVPCCVAPQPRLYRQYHEQPRGIPPVTRSFTISPRSRRKESQEAPSSTRRSAHFENRILRRDCKPILRRSPVLEVTRERVIERCQKRLQRTVYSCPREPRLRRDYVPLPNSISRLASKRTTLR